MMKGRSPAFPYLLNSISTIRDFIVPVSTSIEGCCR